MPRDRLRDRCFVAWNAGDKSGPSNATAVELVDPAIGERFRWTWNIPSKRRDDVSRGLLSAG